jgi:uncharacterized protein YcnI
MLRPARLAAFAALIALSQTGVSHAHVELLRRTAAAGSEFRAVFTVGHGCAGAPTTALHIRLDERIVSATPMSKPGWTLQVKTAAVKQADGSTRQVPREINWTGGNLAADTTAAFAVVVKLPAAPAGTVIYFPIVQECGRTAVRWIETPLEDEDPESLDQPAPFVTLTDGPAAPADAR